MPELLTQTFAIDGLVWVLLMTVLAGIVYGFAGFGAALVFMPVATVFIPVEMAIAAFSVGALSSLVTVVPRAWTEADRPGVTIMIAVATLTIPVGIYILRTNDVTTMRWAVLIVTTVTLLSLISGWRYNTAPGRQARMAVAGSAGIVGGATGLAGPIMILFQLGGQDSVRRSRANTMVFLTITSLLTLPLLAFQGLLTPEAVTLGALMLIPYGIASRVGQALFDPDRQALYRNVAYVIIAGAIVVGLPIWG